MRSKTLAAALAALLAAGLVGGCATTKVQRINPDSVKDLSGNWNDTDSRLVSQEMVQDMLNQAWLSKFRRSEGHDPVVIVGKIHNLSHEHISVDTFINDIQRVLINSGDVQFVADAQQREQIRQERADQDVNSREDTRNAMGQEIGADFMMQGTINTIIDASGDTEVKFYQVDLKLISMADNRTVWIGQKKIKKLVEHSAFRP